MPGFQVNVSMEDPTVQDLAASGAQLYVLRAVQSSDKSGRPIVWSVMQNFSGNTPVTVPAELQAYTSFDPVTEGTQIQVASSHVIQTGQTLNVFAQALSKVATNGIAGTVSIFNTTSTPFTCGLAGGGDDGKLAPFCAFPLYGGNLSTITPLDLLFLQFSSDLIAIGTVVDGPLAGILKAAITPGLLIDMTGASQASVSYDINGGWGGFGVNDQIVSPTADLAGLLIVGPTP